MPSSELEDGIGVLIVFYRCILQWYLAWGKTGRDSLHLSSNADASHLPARSSMEKKVALLDPRWVNEL